MGGVLYLVIGFSWALGAHDGPLLLLGAWFAAVAAVGTFIPGIANQVSLARAYLAAPALVYALAPGRLGSLALVLAVGGLTDLVDGTIAAGGVNELFLKGIGEPHYPCGANPYPGQTPYQPPSPSPSPSPAPTPT